MLIIIIFIPLFIVFFLFIEYIIYKGCNWSNLEDKYSYYNEQNIEKHYFQTINVNSICFKSCVCIGYNRNGLYIKIMFPFNRRFNELFFPWSKLKISEEKILFLTRYEVEIDQIDNTTLVFYGLVFKKNLNKRSIMIL